MTAAALTASGRRAALYTSPHLIRLEERFAIDGEPVTAAQLADAADAVRTASEGLVDRGALPAPPTFFEATTAIAFEIFRRARVDVAVLEVGLGGRFDATNVVTPLAAAITSIDLDHVDLLGSTLGEIAREKAGIIKPDVPVVVGERKPIPRGVIEAASAERGAPLIGAFDGADVHLRMQAGRARIDLRTPHDVYKDVLLSLRGRHQAENAVVAMRLLEALRNVGMPVPRDAIVTGLSSAVWPGRLELVDATRLGRAGQNVLLDAAHNPAGARALAAYLAEWHPGGVPIVFGAMKDKDASGMLAALRSEAAQFPLHSGSDASGEDPRAARRCRIPCSAGCAASTCTKRRGRPSSERLKPMPRRPSAPDRSFSSEKCVLFSADSRRAARRMRIAHPPCSASRSRSPALPPRRRSKAAERSGSS